MAKKRDIIIAVVIGITFIVAISLMVVMFVAMGDGTGSFDLAGLGGDIGIVELFGVINESSARKAIYQIEKFAEGSVDAIVIHINSPGGSVAPSQEIYDAVLRAREEKPVIASMSSVAASGGLYVACAADRVVANPGTLTGSIGVIFQFHTAEGLLKKIGIETETIKSGELKDVGSYSRKMTRREELMLLDVVMDTYEQFVEAVAIGRDMDVEEVRLLANGSVFTGHQAYNYGLVDTLGGLKEAIELAAELAGIDGDPSVVRPYERRDVNVFDLLGGVLGDVKSEINRHSSGPELMFLYQ